MVSVTESHVGAALAFSKIKIEQMLTLKPPSNLNSVIPTPSNALSVQSNASLDESKSHYYP